MYVVFRIIYRQTLYYAHEGTNGSCNSRVEAYLSCLRHSQTDLITRGINVHAQIFALLLTSKPHVWMFYTAIIVQNYVLIWFL